MELITLTERQIKRYTKKGILAEKLAEIEGMNNFTRAMNEFIENHNFTEKELEKAEKQVRYNRLQMTAKELIAYTHLKG